MAKKKKDVMALIDGARILFETIKYNLRHQDYDYVTELAQDYMAYRTGVGLLEKLRCFTRRETETEFGQRKALTIFNTMDLANCVMKPLYKVGKTPAALTFNWKGGNESENATKRKKVLDAGANYWGEKSVQKYVSQRMADLDGIDPNSFMIPEFKERYDPTKPDEKPNLYPFEANSSEAINFIYKNNILQWLIVLNNIMMIDDKGAEVSGEKYYMYLDNQNLTATEIHKDSVNTYLSVNPDVITLLGDEAELDVTKVYLYNTALGEKDEAKKEKGRYFIIRIASHELGVVQPRRVGSVYDPITRYRTCVPVMHAAKCYFEKSIKTMSEFDLTMALHVFPQKFQYADPCPGEPQDGGIPIGCQNGYRPDGKTVCRSCKGSGYKVHTSAQDLIQIRMPKDLSQLRSLEDMVAYKAPPMDLVEFQKQFGFYELKQLAIGSVYNSDVYSPSEISKTATEKTIELDAVYDTLTTFADAQSEMIKHIYRCEAALQNVEEGIEIMHKFPADFKFESLDALLIQLKQANESGAPSHVKKALNKKITYKMYADEPREILKLDTKDKFYPFPGKTETDIQFILANMLTTEYNSVFYAHFDLVFAELEYEQGIKNIDFYELEEGAQRKLIKDKVNQIIVDMGAEASARSAATFDATIETEAGGAPVDKEKTTTTIEEDDTENIDNPAA